MFVALDKLPPDCKINGYVRTARARPKKWNPDPNGLGFDSRWV